MKNESTIFLGTMGAKENSPRIKYLHRKRMSTLQRKTKKTREKIFLDCIINISLKQDVLFYKYTFIIDRPSFFSFDNNQAKRHLQRRNNLFQERCHYVNCLLRQKCLFIILYFCLTFAAPSPVVNNTGEYTTTKLLSHKIICHYRSVIKDQ